MTKNVQVNVKNLCLLEILLSYKIGVKMGIKKAEKYKLSSHGGVFPLEGHPLMVGGHWVPALGGLY